MRGVDLLERDLALVAMVPLVVLRTSWRKVGGIGEGRAYGAKDWRPYRFCHIQFAMVTSVLEAI